MATNGGSVATQGVFADYDPSKTIFVDSTSGNDTNNGQTTTTADATINGGIADATSTRNLIVVRAGSYGGATISSAAVTPMTLRGGYCVGRAHA